MPPEQCEKHDATMSRIFTEIESVKREQGITNTKLDSIIEFKEMVHKIVFGNGKDGLLTKVSKCFHIQNIQWLFLGGIGAGIVGIAVWAVRLLIAEAIKGV